MSDRYGPPAPGEVPGDAICNDCGAAVRYRGIHDRWHQRVDEQIAALIATTWTHTELLDEHADSIVALQGGAR